jgi:2-polyprenyl-6-methoxyphenol hydroxylase-like FAD-dependent oxidoreductase
VAGIPAQLIETPFEADVAIIGAGPVGTLLALLLGRCGKRVALIEKWEHAYARPRAVTYDHEIARILATLGIDSEHDPAINFYDELYYWKNAAREDIQIVDWQSVSASGWRVRYWFNQPDLERRLTKLLDEFPDVMQMRPWEVRGLEQDADGVTLSLHRPSGAEMVQSEVRSLRARYAVGADGANSFVRRALGVENEDRGYFFDWLILDMIPKADYTPSPAQWQLCDPKRPTTIVGGGPGRRRWEFLVLPGETAEEMARDETAWRLLEPWGMTPANAELERSAVYRFQARWAKKWNVGRCMIAGDAAHLMPPFAGEGMCAGVRDAFALSWRLNGILEGTLTPEVLDSYTTERIDHARHYIEFSQQLGKIICIVDEEEARRRDEKMRADLVARNFKPLPTDKCQLGFGAWDPETPHAGELSTQGVVRAGDRSGRFDQVVGHGWMIAGYEADPADALGPHRLSRLHALGGHTVIIGAPGTNCDAEDIDGTYVRWMNEIDARFVFIRPDFYVAATANTAEALRRSFDWVLRRLAVDEPQRVGAI